MAGGKSIKYGWFDGPTQKDPFFDISGVRIVSASREPWTDLTRLSRERPDHWRQVWKDIKQQRPELAALLKDPALKVLNERFSGHILVPRRDLPHTDGTGGG